jgi:hypothetical protein
MTCSFSRNSVVETVTSAPDATWNSSSSL